jgi:hypothetical protein
MSLHGYSCREIVSIALSELRAQGRRFAPGVEEFAVRMLEPELHKSRSHAVAALTTALVGQELGRPSAWDGSIA